MGFTIDLPFISAGGALDREELAKLIVGANWQQRKSMTAHPILMKMAQERAHFVANLPSLQTVTAEHTFPGLGIERANTSPNVWAREMGYLVPIWYGDGNCIESYTTGYKTVIETINAWLLSPHHHDHIAGRSEFFSDQVYYGVGVEFIGNYDPCRIFISSL